MLYPSGIFKKFPENKFTEYCVEKKIKTLGEDKIFVKNYKII